MPEINDDDEDDDMALEQDPSHRFSRYQQKVGSGRFKRVYRGFDEKNGIDVAWSKIERHVNNMELDDETMERITAEMSKGLQLEHPNIIKCFRCWHDTDHDCINLITEFFTSGNLREYRQKHRHLELKAVRKWARQILSGLDYLHLKDPPVIHGDLRCDKIYINGHSGEIKIGDLGLASLLPKRFPEDVLPAGTNPKNQYTRSVDIFAFGLCVLELATKQKLDSHNAAVWPELLDTVQDDETRNFIHRCLGPPAEARPTAMQLLEDAFFSRRLPAPEQHRRPIAAQIAEKEAEERSSRSLAAHDSGSSEGDNEAQRCEVGTVRGEDYDFQFSGRVREGKLQFRLNLEYVGDDSQQDSEVKEPEAQRSRRTIDFAYDPDEDTAERVADEITSLFELSSTDRDICAAALKEWLAKELPDNDSS
ncbi:g6700 [Coccomyxa viridis]|uniref:non-specific serine/threonine protein kinase n=1 Tax=Coccomyxa viridis TaxID=1274662 RepID=A0ABP1FW00_9CHLO